jgi:hypothetical protein
LSSYSFLKSAANRGFYDPIQEVTSPRIDTDNVTRITDRMSAHQSGVYSAAATNFGFAFADDMMKSEMRGTISDLKREPLKTP